MPKKVALSSYSDIKHKGSQEMEYFAHTGTSFVYRHVVMLSEADQFQHMSFANYLRLMFLATDAFLFPCFNLTLLPHRRLELIKAHIHFKQQTMPGDNLLIKIRAFEVENDKFSLTHTFTVNNDVNPVAFGQQTFQVVDPSKNNQPSNLSSDIKDLLHSIQIPKEENTKLIFEVNDNFKPSTIFTFDQLNVFFKHTDFHGFLHPYHFFEWSSYVREAFFSNKCATFRDILNGPIKMMTAKIKLDVFGDSTFGDVIEAQFSTSKIKKVSFDVIIKFINKRTNLKVAQTQHTLVFMDSRSHQFSEIPPALKLEITKYETVKLIS